jgi:hypothetical protein
MSVATSGRYRHQTQYTPIFASYHSSWEPIFNHDQDETSMSNAECLGCGRELDRPGPCPDCGGANRAIHLTARTELKLGQSMTTTRLRQSLEKNKPLLAVVLVITVSSPFLGLFLAGAPGVLAGLVLGILSFALGLFAVTRVRESDTVHH